MIKKDSSQKSHRKPGNGGWGEGGRTLFPPSTPPHPHPDTMLRSGLFVALFIGVYISVGSSAPCTGAAGDFCESVCCLEKGVIEYCCPADTKCCGRQRCCATDTVCSMDCQTNHTECVAGRDPQSSLRSTSPGDAAPASGSEDEDFPSLDDTSCDLSASQCCAGRCCEACCGGTCAPQASACCSAESYPTYCPASAPTCCPIAPPEFNVTCCALESQCCTEGSCPVDSECCGSCNCCNTKTQRCLDSGACEHVPQGMLIPFLILLWGTAFFSNVYVLACLYYDSQRLHREEASKCLTCGHPRHCDLEKCSNLRANSSEDCVTCVRHCQRQKCHGATDCGLPYTAHERMMRKDHEDRSREHVSFKVVHARCPCPTCVCKLCQPTFDCKCTQCQCTACKTSTEYRPFLLSLWFGIAALVVTIICHYAVDPSDFTLSLVVIGCFWYVSFEKLQSKTKYYRVAGAGLLLMLTYTRRKKRSKLRSPAVSQEVPET